MELAPKSCTFFIISDDINIVGDIQIWSYTTLKSTMCNITICDNHMYITFCRTSSVSCPDPFLGTRLPRLVWPVRLQRELIFCNRAQSWQLIRVQSGVSLSSGGSPNHELCHYVRRENTWEFPMPTLQLRMRNIHPQWMNETVYNWQKKTFMDAHNVFFVLF